MVTLDAILDETEEEQGSLDNTQHHSVPLEPTERTPQAGVSLDEKQRPRPPVVYTRITHQRVTVVPWLWKPPGSRLADGPDALEKVGPRSPRTPRGPMVSPRGTSHVEVNHAHRPVENRPASAPTWPTTHRQYHPTPPSHSPRALDPPTSREAGAGRSKKQRFSIAFQSKAAAEGLQLRTKYQSLLLEIGLNRSDIEAEMLLHLEGRMQTAERKRARALGAIKTTLRDQQAVHDRVRASPSEVQVALALTLTIDSQRRLAAALSELRLSSKEVVIACYAWRQEVFGALTSKESSRPRWRNRDSQEVARDQESAMEQVDEVVCWQVIGKVLSQLDFAPLPGGSDPLLLDWFGAQRHLWPTLPARGAGERRGRLDIPRGFESYAMESEQEVGVDALDSTRFLFDAETVHSSEEVVQMRRASKLLRLFLQAPTRANGMRVGMGMGMGMGVPCFCFCFYPCLAAAHAMVWLSICTGDGNSSSETR